MADAVLVNPSGYRLINDQTLPLGLLYTAVFASKEFDIKLIDVRVESDWKSKLINELKKEPKIVSVTSLTGKQILNALEVSKIVKDNSNALVAWGGIHASLLPRQTLENKYIDLIIQGEGEISFYELMKALDKKTPLSEIRGLWYKEDEKIKNNLPRPPLNLDILPTLPYHLLDIKKYIQVRKTRDYRPSINLMTSRGCPNKCTYCFNQKFNYGYWRQRSTEKVMEDIKYVVDKFNLKNIFIMDDNFFVNLKRVEEIAKGISNEFPNITWDVLGAEVSTLKKVDKNYLEMLRKTNCKSMLIGIESGSPRILKLIKKGITVEEIIAVNKMLADSGLRTTYSFISGFPTETDEDLLATIRLIFKLKHDNKNIIPGTIKPLICYPGTEVYESALKNGLKPPQKLEDWAQWYWGNYMNLDIPWISKKKKKMLVDLYYYSVLMNPDYSYINSKLFTLFAKSYIPIAEYRVKNLNFKLPILSKTMAFIQTKFL